MLSELQVPKENFKRVSSLTRFSVLMGKFTSGLVSQLLTSFTSVNYRDLNYISLAGVSTAFFLSMWLPSVSCSIYFHRKDDGENLYESAGFKNVRL